MLLRAIALLALTSLASCGTDISGAKAACGIFSPISYSDSDTKETVAQVEAHDVKYLRLCK